MPSATSLAALPRPVKAVLNPLLKPPCCALRLSLFRETLPVASRSHSVLASSSSSRPTTTPSIRPLPAVVFVQRRTLAMSDKLIPSNPSSVQVIRHVTPNIVTVSVPFLRFEKVPIGGRATIVKMTTGTLAVFSPVALTVEVKATIAELGGNVGYLIAGDIEHHIFLSQWKTEYPDAKLIGPKGLPEKRKASTDPMIGKEDFDFVYDESNAHSNAISDEFAADFDVEYVPAHQNKEIVLYYKPDKVLIEADMMFNMPPTEQYSKVPEGERGGNSFFTKIFWGLNATTGAAKGHKRVLWYAISNSCKDRAGFNASVQRIHGWDFETLIPCHGDTIEGNGKEVFAKIFEWHINGKK